MNIIFEASPKLLPPSSWQIMDKTYSKRFKVEKMGFHLYHLTCIDKLETYE